MTGIPSRRLLVALVPLAAALSLSTACSSSSTPATTNEDGGHVTADSGAGTLYARLGGHAGIRKAINAIVTQELANKDIATYFFFQAGAPKNGHPTADQIEECFTDFVGSATGGTESYPMTLSSDFGNYKCRDLKTAHADLKINEATFTEFVTIAAAELKTLGVASADITTLGGALDGTMSDVVTDTSGKSLQPYPVADGG